MTTKTTPVRINSVPVAGVCEAVQVLFDNDVTTYPEVIARLRKTKLEFSDSTVRTQLHKLRHAAGLTDRSDGPTALVREALAAGRETLEDVCAYLDGRGYDAQGNMPTVRTQFYKQNRARLLALAEANASKAKASKAKAQPRKAKASTKAA